MTIAWANARRHWWTAVLGLLAAGLLMVVVYMLVELSMASDQLDGLRAQQSAQSQVIGSLSSGLSTAESQLAEHGIKPLAPPPQQIIEQGQAGPAGAQGAVGPAGPPGASGVAGATGPSGPAGPSGPSGSAGASGAAGTSGADGAVGPSGPAGPSGPPGPSGASGAAGPACPTGYSLAPEKLGGHDVLVCEQMPPPASSPSGSVSSVPGPSPAAARTTKPPSRGSALVLTSESSTPAVPAPGRRSAPRSGLLLVLVNVVKLPRDPRP